MGFTKLDSGIVNSSIWSEPLSTRVLWITLLAMSDENGFVSCSIPGLIRAANISKEDFETGIKALESPDSFSRTKDNEGRRIEPIDGGWIILNYLKYRIHSVKKKEQTRERVRKFREKRQSAVQCNALQSVTCVTPALPSASVSASASASEDWEAKKGKESSKTIPPELEWVERYCQERKNNIDPQTFVDFYISKGWMIGKEKMKDWQAAIRTWEKKNRGNNNSSQNNGEEEPDGTSKQNKHGVWLIKVNGVWYKDGVKNQF